MIFKTINYNVKRLLGLCTNWAWQLIKILVPRLAEWRNYGVTNVLSEASSGFPGSFRSSVSINNQILETEILTCHHTPFFCQTLSWFSFCRWEHLKLRHQTHLSILTLSNKTVRKDSSLQSWKQLLDVSGHEAHTSWRRPLKTLNCSLRLFFSLLLWCLKQC